MIRRLRLFSGLVMHAYVTMHLLNHAVGLVSLEAMENVLWYISRIWTNRLAQLLLYGSFLVHYALALYALWQRRTLRLRASELSQVVLGFAIPFLARPPRSLDAHLRQFSPHRCRLLRLFAVGLVRSLARIWLRADASLGCRLGSRDDRPAFLAKSTPLVRAPTTHRSSRRSARPRSIATRRDRSGSASYGSSRRPKLDPRANNPAVAGGPEYPRDHHGTAQLVFLRPWLGRYCWRASPVASGGVGMASCASAILTVGLSRSHPAPACSRRAA